MQNDHIIQAWLEKEAKTDPMKKPAGLVLTDQFYRFRVVLRGWLIVVGSTTKMDLVVNRTGSLVDSWFR